MYMNADSIKINLNSPKITPTMWTSNRYGNATLDGHMTNFYTIYSHNYYNVTVLEKTITVGLE